MQRSLPAYLLGLALASTASAQMLIMPDSTTNALVSFSRVDGSVINPNMFALQGGTQIAAIDVNGEVWVTEQVGDRVSRWSITGTFLGNIGPTFPGGGLDNIRGLAKIGDIVYVTNSGTANGAPGNAVVMFDTAGNFLSSFTTTGLAASPFDVLPFQGDVLVSSSSGNNDIHRFTLTGTSVGLFHNSTTLQFAHQLSWSADGNVWVAGFTNGQVHKIDAATGAILTSFTASGARGVFELGNGNVMWTNASGAWVYDVATATSSQVHAGICRHLHLYGAGATTNAYGTGCDGLVLGANGLPYVGNAGFQLVLSNVPFVSPIGFFAFGTAPVNPGLDLTFLGMAGCFAYTSFDIGLFTGSVAIGGVSTFPLSIPSVSNIWGTSFATQGVSLSLLTTSNLAASNGLLFTIGI